MSRPLNKSELLAAIQKEYAALESLIGSLTPEQLVFSPASSAWSIKDILAHLFEWQQMFFTWYETGLRGETPTVPAPGYKLRQLPALNQSIYEKHQNLSPHTVLTLFRESHKKTVQFIHQLSDADLTTPGLYAWMNQNTLLAYLKANTSSHYIWAIKDCKKILKAQQI